MVTKMVETDMIGVYPVFLDDKIDFKVDNEYHLQKQGKGAYAVSVTNNDKISRGTLTVESADYNVVYNYLSCGDGISVLLIIKKPISFKAHDTVFSISLPVEEVVVEEDEPEEVQSMEISSNEEIKTNKPSLFDKYYVGK
uniref:ORF83 protein n=1 Tax=Plutella xylostella granulovirus TaxID=98383 RepID=A0A7U3MXK2_9BBAC|nr:ORF83 protein [Plutella xylostella granulovirus]QKV50126.1 ORF83 protein [Plutella xylostella granulovirus]